MHGDDIKWRPLSPPLPFAGPRDQLYTELPLWVTPASSPSSPPLLLPLQVSRSPRVGWVFLSGGRLRCALFLCRKCMSGLRWVELLWPGGPKGGHLKGGHLKMGFCSEVRT